MQVDLQNAVKHFYPNPSLEMVFYEAVMNAIDAEATMVEINIDIDDFNKPDTLRIRIEDNGHGFDDYSFSKFSKLLRIDDENHKGIGRLVFLHYFQKLDVTSKFKGNCRTFTFTGDFEGDNKLDKIDTETNSTVLKFSGYSKKSIKTYDYLKPEVIKKSLELHFFPVFHTRKLNGKELVITISLSTLVENRDYGFYSDTKQIDVKNLPQLKVASFDAENLDLFQDMKMHYSISRDFQSTTVITAVCAEGRTIPLDLLSIENIPEGYQIIFLLYSEYFTGKVNSSRDNLDIDDYEFRLVKRLFTKNIAKVLEIEVPSIKERNEKVQNSLSEHFPHLEGYFEKETVGLINRSTSLDVAQKKFFNAQKEILECTTLSETQYRKSIEISSRLLMEYILYRTKIINKLKEIDPSSPEADIHNIIVPMKRTLQDSDFINDIYANNAWLLDDKYMTYSKILSDKEMDKLIGEICLDEEMVEKDDSRPDIAIIFSNDPGARAKVDVVIVELKKLDLKLANREEVVSQLKQRARKLLKYYPDKIERIWFYGIVDIDKDFRVSLKENEFTELFSNGQLFYKEQKIIVDEEKDISVLTGLYILSFDAFLRDAECRNSTFLKILKEGMKRYVEDSKVEL